MLHKVIVGLNDAPKDAVSSMGFGGSLLMNITSLPRDMIRELYRNFDGENWILHVGDYKCQISIVDVHDVFGLPYGDLEVNDCGNNEYLELKRFWKDSFADGKECQTPHLVPHLVQALFASERKGGDDLFKKLFLMLALSAVLTPSANTKMHYKLVHVVDDIANVKNYDWCSYVLQHLGESALKYSDNKRHIPGCSLLLFVCYFQRYLFRGQGSPRKLPLIRHWTYEGFKSRIKAQGGIYSGAFLDETYPINVVEKKFVAVGLKSKRKKVKNLKPAGKVSKKTKVEKIAVEVPKQRIDSGEVPKKRNDSAEVSKQKNVDEDRFVKFRLPDHIQTDSEILVNCNNELEKKYLLLQRNVKLLSFIIETNVDSMKSCSEQLGNTSVSEKTKEKSPSLSQISMLPSNDLFWSEIDRLTKRVSDMKDEFPSFALFRSDNPDFHTPPDNTFADIFGQMRDDAVICGLSSVNAEKGDRVEVHCETKVDEDVLADYPTISLNSQDEVMKMCDSYFADQAGVIGELSLEEPGHGDDRAAGVEEAANEEEVGVAFDQAAAVAATILCSASSDFDNQQAAAIDVNKHFSYDWFKILIMILLYFTYLIRMSSF